MRAKPRLVNDEQQIVIFEELKDVLSGYCIASVAEIAEVGEATLYFWLDGTTRKPRLDTISKVAAALGYELRLHKTKTGKQFMKRRHLKIVK